MRIFLGAVYRSRNNSRGYIFINAMELHSKEWECQTLGGRLGRRRSDQYASVFQAWSSSMWRSISKLQINLFCSLLSFGSSWFGIMDPIIFFLSFFFLSRAGILQVHVEGIVSWDVVCVRLMGCGECVAWKSIWHTFLSRKDGGRAAGNDS